MPTLKSKESNFAEKRFRKYFTKLSKPDEEAILPKKLSSLPSDKLSDIQTRYTAWREFTEDLLVEALAEYTRLKEEYEYAFNKKLLVTNAKSLREKEAIVRTDLNIRKLFLSLQEAELYYNLLSSKIESYNNCLTVISREITRRTSNA
jgi:hypothetical protein